MSFANLPTACSVFLFLGQGPQYSCLRTIALHPQFTSQMFVSSMEITSAVLPFLGCFQRTERALMLLSSTPHYCYQTPKLYACPTYFRNPSPITPFIPLSIQVELFHGPSSAVQFSSTIHHILHFLHLDFLFTSPQFHKMNLKQLIFLNYLL